MAYLTIEQEIQRQSKLLENFDDPMERYQLIIDFGDKLPELNDEFRIDENRVLGCQSNLWMKNFGTEQLELRAYSEAFIVRGLAQMVLEIYNGKTKDEILATDPNILENLGIAGLLTPGRQNGIGNLIKKVYEYAGQ